MRRSIALALALAAVGMAVGAQQVKVVATDWPPYTALRDGRPSGLAVDIVSGVFDSMGVKYRFEFMPWERAVQEATFGDADAIVSLSYKKDRDDFLYFPKTPLHDSRYVFFVRKGDVEKVAWSGKYESFAGWKFGLTRGYTYASELLAFVESKASADMGDDDAASLRKLSAKRIDVFPCDLANGIALLKSLGLHGQIVALPGPAITSKDYFIGFARKSQRPDMAAFAREFDAALLAFKKTAAYAAIEAEYIQ